MIMPHKMTTRSQDVIIAEAESCTIIDDLLKIIENLNERLEEAIERLEVHGIESSDI